MTIVHESLTRNAKIVLSMLPPPGNKVSIGHIATDLKQSEKKIRQHLSAIRKSGYGIDVSEDVRMVWATVDGWPRIEADAHMFADEREASESI